MDNFLNPEEVLKKLELKEDMVVADFGCGSGGWALPLAKRVKKVLAVDILEEPLSALRSKAKMMNISNIDALKANVEKGTTIISSSVDLVLMTNLLFQADDIKKIFEEGKRVLKDGGEILVVDWKEEAKIGPQTKISSEKVKEIGKEVGLKIKKEFEAGAFHYAILFGK